MWEINYNIFAILKLLKLITLGVFWINLNSPNFDKCKGFPEFVRKG